ncbi:MAG: hypothetical protein PQJ59_06345 [Spirochaetales bacterium]|nr:hypothetical protein [Spirochaetales bacterium]
MKRHISRISALLLLSLTGLVSCTNNPPQILDLWWLPVLVQDSRSGDTHRELMLYVQVDDEEGDEDLAQIRLENLDKEILWKTDSSSWSRWKGKGVLWIGSSRFVSYGTALEEGAYRVILEDKGGREDQTPLELEGWYDREDWENQVIKYEEGEAFIASPVDGWFILPGGEKADPVPVPVEETFYPSRLTEREEGEFFFFLFDRSRMTAYKKGPYPFESAE